MSLQNCFGQFPAYFEAISRSKALKWKSMKTPSTLTLHPPFELDVQGRTAENICFTIFEEFFKSLPNVWMNIVLHNSCRAFVKYLLRFQLSSTKIWPFILCHDSCLRNKGKLHGGGKYHVHIETITSNLFLPLSFILFSIPLLPQIIWTETPMDI